MADREVAVVTGGAAGMGRAIADALEAAGFAVVVADLAAADERPNLTGHVVGHVVDLGVAEQVRAFGETVLDRFGRCDVLVNNAAYQTVRPLEKIDLAEWRRFQAVNVEAPLLLAQAFTPGMAARGSGRIINILSNTVWQPPAAGFVSYITTKGAMLGFTRSLARELGGRGITVNAVAPGLTDTPGARRDLPDEFFDAVRAQQAIPRTTQPADVAALVAFLASGAARAITGQAMRVDGGLVTI